LTPRWVSFTGCTLSLCGLAVSAYLTFEHFTSSSSLTCPATGGIVNCLKVTTSSYSKIAGVPVSVLGLVFFAIMAVLQSPPAWSSPALTVRAGRILWSIVGVGTALWLVYAELSKLDAVCLWCTSVHVISLGLFILTAFATAWLEPETDAA